MILQLSTGRFIEISVEEYLDLTDLDIQYLNSLGFNHTKDNPDPWYGNLLDIKKPNDDEDV